MKKLILISLLVLSGCKFDSYATDRCVHEKVFLQCINSANTFQNKDTVEQCSISANHIAYRLEKNVPEQCK